MLGMARTRKFARSWWLAMAAATAMAPFLPRPASAYTPDSPEVRAMVDQALKWLSGQDDDRLGGKCLIGLAFFKAGKGLNHPKVQAAQRGCETSAAEISSPDNYSIGLAVVFLLESDPAKNKKLAERYVSEILRR